jgi:lipopolysaccharide transport system ATP-binding protein
MSDIAIKFDNISKQYHLGKIGTGTISHDLNRWWAKVKGREDPYLKIGEVNRRDTKAEGDYVWALRDINLEVKQGEVLGIIGKNGAGKSTLLKLLSRVTAPTTGQILVKGRIASLLEVGTGFHPEMTGRENIFMNGAIMGMTKAEIRRKFDEIVDFAGVEKYIDTPVKRYSSGMTVRLGFAVAAHLEPEILVVDEVLAVGDAEFQKKAIGKMQDVSHEQGRTVLFVSHNMAAVTQLCTSCLLIRDGSIFAQDNVDRVVDDYLKASATLSYYTNNIYVQERDVWFKEIRIVDEHLNDKSQFYVSEPVFVLFKLAIKGNRQKYDLFCMILDKRQSRVFAAECELLDYTMLLKINPNFLVRGQYSLHAMINIPRLKQEDTAEGVCHFEISDNESVMSKHGDYNYGCVFGSYEWLNIQHK